MLSFGRQLVSRGLSPSVEGAGRPTVNSPRCLPTSKRDSRVVRKLWPKAILQSFGLALVDPSNRDAFRSTCFHRLFCPLAMGLKAVIWPPPCKTISQRYISPGVPLIIPPCDGTSMQGLPCRKPTLRGQEPLKPEIYRAGPVPLML